MSPHQENGVALSEQLLSWICELVPTWAPRDIGGFRYLDGGYSNRNYRFTHRDSIYVLRAPFRERPLVDRHLERELLQARRVPAAPEVIAFDVVSGRMISRWVQGHLLADLSPDPEQVVGYLRQLHADLPETDRSFDPLAQAKLYLKNVPAPRWIGELAHRVVWPQADSISCHNDLNPWNVIREPDGRWVTLDWEWFGRNDPLFDLVTLHQSLALDPDLLVEMSGALLQRRVGEARLKTCLTAFWLREYAWAAAEIAAGDTRPEILEQQLRGVESLRALT
jgi:thiamine kinase-like enzyme